MRHRVALEGDQTGGLHLAHHIPGQEVVVRADVVWEDEDRRLDVVLLEQGEENGIVVLVAVVEGQDHGLLVGGELGQVLEPDRGEAVLLDIFELGFQISLRNEQLPDAAGEGLAGGVVHHDRHLSSARDFGNVRQRRIEDVVFLAVEILGIAEGFRERPAGQIPVLPVIEDAVGSVRILEGFPAEADRADQFSVGGRLRAGRIRPKQFEIGRLEHGARHGNAGGLSVELRHCDPVDRCLSAQLDKGLRVEDVVFAAVEVLGISKGHREIPTWQIPVVSVKGRTVGFVRILEGLAAETDRAGVFSVGGFLLQGHVRPKQLQIRRLDQSARRGNAGVRSVELWHLGRVDRRLSAQLDRGFGKRGRGEFLPFLRMQVAEQDLGKLGAGAVILRTQIQSIVLQIAEQDILLRRPDHCILRIVADQSRILIGGEAACQLRFAGKSVEECHELLACRQSSEAEDRRRRLRRGLDALHKSMLVIPDDCVAVPCTLRDV